MGHSKATGGTNLSWPGATPFLAKNASQTTSPSPTCDLTLNNGLFLHSLAQVTIKMLCPSTSTFTSAAALKSASHFPSPFLKFQRTGLLLNSSRHSSHSSAH